MLIPKKHWTISILVIVVLAIILISASLSSLELRPGRSLPVAMENEETDTSNITSPNPFISIVIKFCLLISGVLIPLSIIYHLRSPQGRRRILMFISICLIFFFLKEHINWNRFKSQIPNIDIQTQAANRSLTPAEEFIPNPPWWLILMTSLGLSALIMGAFLFLWRRFRRKPTPLELVAKEAQKTLDILHTGANLEEGVIHCYYEMNQVLSERRGLKRQHAMSAREFENYLEDVGLPGVHIRRLTRLFEKVRYGAKNLAKIEDQEAIACLTAIVQACKGSQ